MSDDRGKLEWGSSKLRARAATGVGGQEQISQIYGLKSLNSSLQAVTEWSFQQVSEIHVSKALSDMQKMGLRQGDQ